MNEKSKRSARGRRQAGFSAIEAITGLSLSTLLVLGVMNTTIGILRAGAQYRTTGRMAMSVQAADDEVLYQMRSGSEILAAQTVNGTGYTTSGTSIVFKAPGYDNGSSSSSTPAVLDSVEDYAAFAWNAADRTFVESLQPGSGSARPSRTQLVLAKNVNSVAFTYYGRDQFQATTTGTVTSPALSTTPIGTPQVYVNGNLQASGVTYNSSTNKVAVAIASSIGAGADVQIVYQISPTNTAGLKYVTQVDAVLNLAGTDNNQATHTLRLSGRARLRNCRR